MPPIEEKVKDNQWWYSNSLLCQQVEGSICIEISVNGRRCILEKSANGSDGRETRSFKFVRDDDRKYWRSLNSQIAFLEVLNTNASRADAEDDQEDEYIAIDLAENNARIQVPFEDVMPEITIDRVPGNLPNFDAYIFVDWSANNSPKTGKDSIWIAEGYWEKDRLIYGPDDSTCCNPSTREKAIKYIRSRLSYYVKAKQRVLVCFDFPYSYPICNESNVFASTFKELWRNLHERISDDGRNQSNRFVVANDLNVMINRPSGQGPFWGRPLTGYAANLPRLATTKPTDNAIPTFREFRVVEERLRNSSYRPFSVWQLFGNGSVGSQTLVGLPRLFELRYCEEFHSHSRVWPFETDWGFSFQDRPLIIHAEFWPGVIDVNLTFHPIKDASQVISCVAWAAKKDNSGSLGQFFDPLRQDDPQRDLARREGWILGFKEPNASKLEQATSAL